jgi:hypothetical protein
MIYMLRIGSLVVSRRSYAFYICCYNTEHLVQLVTMLKMPSRQYEVLVLQLLVFKLAL